MRCPFCTQPSNRVIDSRVAKDGFAIRRRRECEACGRRFTTYERVEEILPMVVKKDGRRESFERAKIISGLKRACEKRPVPAEEVDRIADDIERALMESGEREVKSEFVGEAVMRALHQLDEVAYVRFASVYRSFKDLNEFMDELKDLLRRAPTRLSAQNETPPRAPSEPARGLADLSPGATPPRNSTSARKEKPR